ncbi:hypothetical protein CBFG_00324 [Clostridiales bacterium 1_7_47FAA]|nr:hypothetical protein CBFG_00324 [Clostridiales bacterium 1_7_47FAA]
METGIPGSGPDRRTMMDGGGMTCTDGKSGDIPQAFSVRRSIWIFLIICLTKITVSCIVTVRTVTNTITL